MFSPAAMADVPDYYFTIKERPLTEEELKELKEQERKEKIKNIKMNVYALSGLIFSFLGIINFIFLIRGGIFCWRLKKLIDDY